MDDQNMFNTPEQEVIMLAKELGEIKEVLREITRKLTRIEARASRAFPSAFKKPSKREKGPAQLSSPPTMTEDQVMSLYDDLVDLARNENMEEVRRRLDSLELSNLNLLRTELGASLKNKKPSKRIIIDAILGRVNESLMMTKHINRDLLIETVNNEEVKTEQPEKEHE